MTAAIAQSQAASTQIKERPPADITGHAQLDQQENRVEVESLRSVATHIRHVTALLNQEVDRRLTPMHLTLTKATPLLLLLHSQCATVTSIARCGHLDPGAMTRVVSELETMGLILRERSREDRRVVHLELTSLGKQIAAKATTVCSEVLDLHLSGFSQHERDELLGYLRRMSVNGA